MDSFQRGRSPSAGSARQTQNKPRSPSAQNGFNQGFDPTSQNATSALHVPGQSTSFLGPDYMPNMTQQQFPQSSNMSQSQQSQMQPSQQFLQGSQGSMGAYVDINQSGFQDVNFQDPGFDAAFDPSLLDMSGASMGNFGLGTSSSENNISPRTANFAGMSATPFQQDQSFGNASQTPSDPAARHQSLSPASAASPFGQSGREWAGVMSNFQGHRRNQSDALSDVSSSAAHHSPFVDTNDTFDVNGTSPLMNGHNDPNLPDSLQMGTFTLSDNIAHHISPGHSNQPSPRISPQQEGFLGAGAYTFNDGLGLAQQVQAEQFPGIQSTEFDATQHLEAPEISIQFAPERQPSFNESGQAAQDHDALSPPTRGQNRPRGRAISDPYSTLNQQMSRSSTPNRNRAPSLGLQPPNARSLSRSSSPGGPLNGVHKPRDRASSTSAVPSQREKLMNLAEADKLASFDGVSSGASVSGGEGGPKRTQKHPATFQCHLCPKRFTRAYNLRSHLRTHTDERPFVCTVCGKAFARQHDRKRHEGLHSGEKKFVCRGLLAGGSGNAGTWGCGRRFARADALGRHFRSEAGRACIKPLLDEEARERRAAMMEQHSQDMMNNPSVVGAGSGGMGAPPMPGMALASDQPLDVSSIALPAALLAQYPALAGIQWDALPAVGPGGGGADDDDFGFDASGRSSFEASSGGELDFDDEAFSGNEDSWAGGGAVGGSMHEQNTASWGGGYVGGG